MFHHAKEIVTDSLNWIIMNLCQNISIRHILKMRFCENAHILKRNGVLGLLKTRLRLNAKNITDIDFGAESMNLTEEY
jgi:hypothetical protein